jgi:hypothetical protein
MGNFNPDDFRPKPTDWFSAEVDYAGWGTATFSNPKGRLEGNALAKYDQHGGASIEMHVEKLVIVDEGKEEEIVPSRFDLDAFITGVKGEVLSDTLRVGVFPVPTNNHCERLEISTSDGEWSSDDDPVRYKLPDVFGKVIRFTTFQSHFEVQKGRENGKYFVLPLINFLTNELRPPHREFKHHPLRLVSTPSIPDELIGEERVYALSASQAKWIIGFLFGGKPAFIELLLDYENRKRDLYERREQSLITAIMAGDIEGEQWDIESWRSSGLNDILAILSFANGTRVGAPWIEIRDKDGGLLRRLHINSSPQRYEKGMPALGPGLKAGGIAYLLMRAQESTHFGNINLRAVMSQIMLAGYLHAPGNVEDQMTHLFRALETLCKFTLKPAILRAVVKDEILGESMYGQVEESILHAKEQVKKLRKEIKKNAGESEDARVATLDGILSHLGRWTDLGFRKEVQKLLEEFNLNDEEILNKHYEAKGRGKNKWISFVREYRASVVHGSWLDWDNKPDVEEIVAITYHIRDILVRITLKILAYDGEYCPFIPDSSAISRPLDWVTPDTTAQELGYR